MAERQKRHGDLEVQGHWETTFHNIESSNIYKGSDPEKEDADSILIIDVDYEQGYKRIFASDPNEGE